MGIFGWFRQPSDGRLTRELTQELRELRADVTALRETDRLLGDRLEEITHEIGDLADKVRAQTIAIAEGIERVDRSERRVRAVVQRAQSRLADAGYEDAALEAEAAELQPLDGAERDGSGMQLLHEGLADDGPRFDPTGIPGDFSADVLTRGAAYGLNGDLP